MWAVGGQSLNLLQGHGSAPASCCCGGRSAGENSRDRQRAGNSDRGHENLG